LHHLVERLAARCNLKALKNDVGRGLFTSVKGPVGTAGSERKQVYFSSAKQLHEFTISQGTSHYYKNEDWQSS